MKAKNIIKCVLFTSILFTTLGLINNYFFKKETKTDNTVTNYIREDENTLDGTFLGSSTVFHGIIPTQIWKEAGLTSRVIAKGPFHPGLDLDVLELIFKKQRDSIRFVYIDIVGFFYLNDESIHDFLVDYYYSFPEGSKERDELVYKYPTLREYHKKNYNLDETLFKTHNDFRKNDFWQQFTAEDNDYTKGFYAQNYGEPCTRFEIPDGEPISLQEKNADGFKYLTEVLSFADKHPETKFIFARTVRQLCDKGEAEVDTFVFEWIKNYIQNERPKEITGARKDYLVEDFALIADEIGIDEKTDLRDPIHLNVKGAIKNTKYLSEYLKTNIDVTSITHSKKVKDDFDDCYKKTENYLQYIQENNIKH
ncbi:MAG TPA: hypothetical protein DDW20_05735 [Firmicutes bacterium]|nr:hypothetical protein [Bacillota bacterium]